MLPPSLSRQGNLDQIRAATPNLKNRVQAASRFGKPSGDLFVLSASRQKKSMPRFGMSPSFHEAVETGDPEAVRKWIKQLKPEQLNAPGPNQASPLWTAVFHGHSQIVKILIAAKANMDQPDQKNGWPPLITACMMQHPKIAEQLVDAGADINGQERELGLTPLLMAINQGYDALAERLIWKGANVNQPNRLGQTPLLTACYKGSLPLARQLFRAGAGATLNQADPQLGLTPLSAACMAQNIDLVQELIRQHAKVNQATRDGNTPLAIAAHLGRADIAQALMSHGADVNQANETGDTPLGIAAHLGHADIVRQLLARKETRVTQANHDGHTPLALAHRQLQENPGHPPTSPYFNIIYILRRAEHTQKALDTIPNPDLPPSF